MPGSKWTPVVVLLACLCKAVVCVPPTFDPINPIQVQENTPAGTPIGVLTVGDSTPSHITVTLSSTTQQYVYLNQENSTNGFFNASIVLQRQLDYETDGSSLKLLFTATNPSTPDGVRQSVTVIIEDVNDVPPQFLGLPYSVSVPENASINTVIFTANSTDPDTGIGGLVNYSMQTSHPEYRSKFNVSRTGNVHVTLIGDLDYETLSFYQFTIVATDGGGLTSEAQLFVTVTDVQDRPPYFTGGPYLPDIWEDHAKNSNVVTISALDGDRGNPNNITYNITDGTCPGYFNVDPTSGSIDLIKDADRDSGIVLQNNGICVINIQAVEVTSSGTFGATANDTVTVTIKDKNDNLPTFNSSHYEATIQENMPAGIPITFTTQTVHVEDLDQGDNAKLSLTLDLYSSTYFEIVPSTVQGSANLLIRVKDNTILDYEQIQSITLTVWANETSTPEGNSASTTIHLKITNQNDNSPNFTRSDYSASVREGSNVSTSVITVKALDLDLPNFGAVNYSLRGDDGMFAIDSSGLVTVASHQLDRETKSVYYISVEATDPGGLKDTAQLTVNITDANDNAPVFGRDYDGYLKENDTSFSRPITVSAKDDDVGVNAQVTYSINRTYPSGLDAHFAVDGVSGVLSVPSPLDYETVNSSLVVVSVRATDNGTHQLYSDVNVTLTLQDINDNTPVFQPGSYKHSIPERTGTDAPVVTVTATDADGSKPNNQVFYLIESGASDAFKINGTSGEITVAGDLDREKIAKYTLLVKAMDRGSPVLSSFVNVTVNILDVNDENPTFSRDVQFASVYETGKSEQLYTFNATDPDKDSSLSYDIYWDGSSGRDDLQKSVNKSYLQRVVNINQSSGEVVTIAELDRERLTAITLVVVVVDTNANTTGQTATGTLSITVLDINDNSPTFSSTNYSAEVLENMPEGTPITFTTPSDMSVSDADYETNSEFQLIVGGGFRDVFTPVPTTVRSSSSVILRIHNSTWLDYEEHHSFTIKLIATETETSSKRSSTATVNIQILDANDNSPMFLNTSYSITIPENTSTQASVVNITATDPDSDRYTMGTYTLSGSENKFEIDNNTGEVKVFADLNREVKSQYFMTVTAEDKGGRKQTVPLTVTLSDVNDNSPKFRLNEYIGNIKENQNNFSTEVRVSATDADEAHNSNSQITFSLDSSQLANNFSINGSSGVISPVGPLDYENLPPSLQGSIVLTVIATDGGSPSFSSNATVQINVQDENDNDPVFNDTTYSGDVMESGNPGEHILQVFATDRDGTAQNSEVFYILLGEGSYKFQIDGSSGNISTAATLDREAKAQYQLTVMAMDRGTPPRSSTANVTITVKDVNDDVPTFPQITVTTSVNETNATGRILANIFAIDRDQDAQLDYTILWNISSGLDEDLNDVNISRIQEILKVNSSSGNIVLIGDLDREEIELITLVLHVRDAKAVQRKPQTATATLTMSVLDVDDNTPTFNKNIYAAFIEENSQPGIPLTLQPPSSITVEDKDKDLNSEFSLSLLNHGDIFDVVPSVARSTATVLVRVKNSSSLDYEQIKNMTLTLMANETKVRHPRSSIVTIQLNITDANDNDPVFDSPSYTGSVPENAPANHTILKVEAHDNDSALFDVKSYGLLGTHSDFVLNHVTGELLVAVGSNLDREIQPTYSLSVEVVDKGGRRSSVPVTVNLTDVNDNPPVFTRVEYSANLVEGDLHFDRPLQIKTTDADLEGTNNTAVFYSIQPSSIPLSTNFSINRAGVLTCLSPIDYEAPDVKSSHGILDLLVVAKDGGIPQLSSNVTVTIHVEDMNDNTPRFTNEPYTASIPENATYGTFVMTVSATDQDGETPNNQVMFVIDSGGSDNFRVNGRTGRITVQTGAALDREQEANYSLVVVTIDQGTPPLSSNTTVIVNITDVNDEPPAFSVDSSSSASFTENSTGNCSYTFSATDLDEISLLNYTILWDRSLAYDERGGNVNISLVKDWFSVNATTGDLCSLPYVIDRETAESITIMVQVRDLKAEENIDEQTATASVSVTIGDINDNYPQIVQGNNIAVNVSEGTPVGTVIKTLEATDRDLRQTVTFSTTSVDFNITKKGRISLAKKLDRETATTVNFTIYATDDGSPPLNSSSTINIVVLDTNDNDPQFSMSTYSFNVSEDSTNGKVVATVTATDKDEGHNANVTYLLGDDKGGLFRMDSITGDIILEGLLDREYVSTYSLTITARDNPVFETPRLKRTTITINVTDVNDNSPQFHTDYQSIKISEKSNQGDAILTVHATDKDIGNNGKVWYSLQDSSVLFTIDAITGAITAAMDLLGLADIYNLTVVATDEGIGNLTGNSTVTITVLDENLNKPVFVNVTDIPPIPECSQVGSQIFQFFATDADRDKVYNGRVEFNVTVDTPGTTKDHFRLDKSTGSLTVQKKLNSEERSTFTLKVLAYDLGSPSLSTISKQYTIKLKDINDNPPMFNQSDKRQKHFSVPENVNNTQLGPIRAEDPDKDSQICYTLSESIYIVNLKMMPSTDNRTLYLDVVQSFDRENVTSFTVKITATDCSPSFYSQLCDNSSLNSTTVTPSSLITTITILDKNDNPPVYRQPVLSKGIRNTVTLGRIIFELDTLVYDRDSPKFSRHAFYRVNATEADPTLLNTFNPEKHPIPISLTENGTVATNMSFSANMYGFFNMKVAVNDSAGMDMAELKIFIIADFQVLKITFLQSIDDVLRIQDDVLRDMSNATGYTFLTNDDVASHLDADGNIQPYHSDMFVHAVDPLTGKILDAENTRRIIDRNQALGSKLINKYKVTQVGEADASVAKRDDSERRMYILISVVCLLSFTLLLLIYISCNRIQRYRRKLKAATIDVKGPKHEETEETGNVNFNPLFNKDIAMQEEMDSTSIVSGDSLDNNMVLDGNTAKKDDEQEFTVNFFDEKQQIRYGNNALGEVLRQYDFIDEEMGTRGHDMEDSASSSSEQGNSRTNGKLMMKRDQDLGDVDNLESTDI